jgi:hypothetical protein
MSALMEFLKAVGDRQVFCCQWFEDNGNRVGMNGKIFAYDDKHIVIESKTAMHLVHVEDIIEIEFEKQVEIVAP